jgi:hypothetical protein
MRDGAHTHHDHQSSSSTFDQLGELIATLAVCVAGIDLLMWVLHILVIIATGIGFLALGTGAGWTWIKVRQLRRRRAWPPIQPGARQGVFPPYYHPPAYPQLPPGGGDLHLHLPPGMTADELRQLMTHQNRAG